MKAVVFNHTEHKELWDWLSKNPTMDKKHWPGWEYNGGPYSYVTNECFACEYAWNCYTGIDENDYTPVCKNCPIEWAGTYECGNTIYRKWFEAQYRKRYDEAAQLATEIRDLPVKKGVLCE